MKRIYVRNKPKLLPHQVTEMLVKDLSNRGWVIGFSDWMELAVDYLVGDMHWGGLLGADHIEMRYEIPEEQAQQIWKFMEKNYSKYIDM